KKFPPRPGVGQDLLLDREGCVDVTLGERACDARGYAEIGKGLLHSISLLWVVQRVLLGRDPSASTALRRNRRRQPSRDDDAVRGARVPVAARRARNGPFSASRVH